jgi:hypothetical protein
MNTTTQETIANTAKKPEQPRAVRHEGNSQVRQLHVFHITAYLDELRVERRRLTDPETLPAGSTEFPNLIEKKSLGNLTAASFGKLRQILVEMDFDAVVIDIPEFPELYQPFPHRNPLKNVTGLLPYARFSISFALLHRLVDSTDTPLFLFENLDATVIDSRWLPFIPKCRYFFKRELPKCTANAFLYSTRVSIEAWKNLIRFDDYLDKLLPLSEGFHDEIAQREVPRVEKEIDIFWAGNINISPVRQRGYELLKKFRDRGYRVDLCEQKVGRDEFYEKIARSYLVWSPEGTAWQCYRHLEVCAMESVPLLTYPTIWQDKPLREGEHCFTYDPEDEHLLEVAAEVLEDKERLIRMGKAARPFVLKNHMKSSIYLRHLFEQVGR